jgi:hypothetical protein
LVVGRVVGRVVVGLVPPIPGAFLSAASVMTSPAPAAAPAARAVGVLFGLNYVGTPSELRGCVNDVNDMAAYLESRGVRCEVHGSAGECTAAGITDALRRAAAGDHEYVYFHYSGHGTSVPDVDGDETDGLDECLVPEDVATAGLVTDDAVHAALAAFRPTTRVVAVFDSCHSGTVADLAHAWDPAGRAWAPGAGGGGPLAADVVSLSGCLDDQTSADALIDPAAGRFGGALTTCLLAVLRASPGLTPEDAADAARAELARRGFGQVPRLCASRLPADLRPLVPDFR